jgi:hypothetical protein
MYLRDRVPGAGRPLRGTVFWAVVVLGVGKASAIEDKKKAKSSRAMLEDILNVCKDRLIGEDGYAVLPPVLSKNSREWLLRHPMMINWNRNGSTEQG